MNLRDFNNIAIIQTAFIGDVVLTMPLVQAIRNENLNCRITFITTPQASEIPELCKAVDDVVVLDKRNKHKSISSLIGFANHLNKNKFDLWISAHRSFRTSVISMFINSKFKVGFANSSFGIVYNKKIPYINEMHEIERNLELISIFNSKSNVNLKDVSLNLNVSNFTTDITLDAKKNYVVIAPGSVWETKKWRKENYIDLCKMLISSGTKVILSGSKLDIDLCNEIAAKSGAVSIAGKTNIEQTLLLIKSAKLLITNDSAPTHFAGLMNTPVITIYGPTSPIFGFAPRSDIRMVIRNEELKCSPCRIHGSEKCPINTHECMKSITPEFVFSESNKLIGLK